MTKNLFLLIYYDGWMDDGIKIMLLLSGDSKIGVDR